MLPVSRGLLVAVVAVICVLVAFPVVESFVEKGGRSGLVMALAIAEVVIGLVGAVLLHRGGQQLGKPASQPQWRSVLWLIALCLPWAGLIVVTRQAAYLGLVLYFLALWLLPPVLGALAALGLAVLTGLGQSVHHGYSTGAFVGPIAAAAALVAVMIGVRALIAESEARADLIVALEDAQARLADAEREKGRLGERARLGRELHDTVAQHLSSIQLLLHAAESAGDRSRATHVRAARDSAATALAETRAFISELTPPPLEGATLAAALRRVAGAASARTGMACTVEVAGDERPLPIPIETTILRIAQEALANVERHARAHNVALRLGYESGAVSIEVGDDGVGFDSEQQTPDVSFGVDGMRSRAAELGGYAVVVSEPGEGALVSARIPVSDDPAEEARA